MSPEHCYSVVVKWSQEDAAFVAVIPELNGISGVSADRAEAVQIALEGAAMALEVLREDGLAAPLPNLLHPFSGQLRLRLPVGLHRSLALEAEQEGVSLNTLLVSLLSEPQGRRYGQRPLVLVAEPELSLHAESARLQLQVIQGGRQV